MFFFTGNRHFATMTLPEIEFQLGERNALRRELDRLSTLPIEEVIEATVTDIGTRLEKLNTNIAKALRQQADVKVEDINEEFNDAIKYRSLWQALIAKLQEFNADTAAVPTVDHQSQHDRQSIQGNVLDQNQVDLDGQGQVTHTPIIQQQRMQYPKLSFIKFDGQIKNWIHWWGKFGKIHDDKSIPQQDKFEYLLQATEGRVHDLVRKYPPSAGNYDKIMNLLFNRYGDKKTLTSFYIRQLSEIIKQSNRFDSLSSLYEELRSNISNLETLGLTHDQILVIVPLIESSLPLETLIAWEEFQAAGTSGSLAGSRLSLQDELVTDLDQIMDFLSRKVESQERAHLKHEPVDTMFQLQEPQPETNLPTAATLVNTARSGNRNTVGTNPGRRQSAGAPQGNRNAPGTVPNNQSSTGACTHESDQTVSQQPPPGGGSQTGRFPRRKSIICVFCNYRHPSSECRRAQEWTLEEKKAILAEKLACYICLVVGHTATDCAVMAKCVLCGRRHYVLMCPEVDERHQRGKGGTATTANSNNRQPHNTPNNTTTMCVATSSRIHFSPVLMKTMYLFIVPMSQARYRARGFLDGGSAFSFVREIIAKRLNLPVLGRFRTTHGLFGGKTLEIEHTIYLVTLQSLDGSVKRAFKFFGQARICSTIDSRPSPELLQKLKSMNITLTDEGEESPEIDLLFGTNLEAVILTEDIRVITPEIKAIRTIFGWTLTGETDPTSTHTFEQMSTAGYANVPVLRDKEPTVHNMPQVPTPCILNYSAEDFWELEAFGRSDIRNETEYFTNFQKTIIRTPEGRYQVKLPWSGDKANLGTNYFTAYKRLQALTKKLTKHGQFDAYQDVLNQWARDEIIEIVHDDDKNQGHYVPHHAVVKENSTTTKIRPVSDANTKTETGVSINNLLSKGTNLIHTIPGMFLNFRFGTIGLTADIKQAFLQIGLDPQDRPYLKFLWWDDERRKIVTYHHCRVVFGLTASPFLLAATLRHHFSQIDSPIARELDRSFYVDNLATSIDDTHELNQFMTEADTILRTGGFELRQWQHTRLPETEHHPTPEIERMECCTSESFSVLGLQWDKGLDTLYFEAPTPRPQQDITKRFMLSIVMTIFDPIGFTAPYTIQAKILIQRAWGLKADWDKPLPMIIAENFRRWYHTLPSLTKCHIPRYLFQSQWAPLTTSIHAFSDGSQDAYAACIFIRTQVQDHVQVTLVTAKARVTPSKFGKKEKKTAGTTNDDLTIPRIELLGALLLAQLYAQISRDERFLQFPLFCWTDSEIVLCWLRQTQVWKPFVSNRVTTILKNTKLENWRHVPGKANPADIISRGCDADQLYTDKWWMGPKWLYEEPSAWPRAEKIAEAPPRAFLEAKKRVPTLLITVSSEESLFQQIVGRFSSYNKQVRIVAWIRRFAGNASKRDKRQGELNGDELTSAEALLIRYVQESSDTAQAIKQLDCFRDDAGLLRVRTRLALGHDSSRFKYPILLPHQHVIVESIIRTVHRESQHAGVSTVMVKIRETFWLTGARRTIKKVLNECIPCKKLKVKSALAPIAPLPTDRFDEDIPFRTVGVDLAGPMYTQDVPKNWTVIFTCATFRAVHLELVPSIGTESFLMALRRFMARRGRVRKIYCDNGTNFVGADNELAKLNWSEILQQTSVSRIIWQFSAPAAPWWGGFWERLIGLLKNLLKRTMGAARLTLEQLYTLIVECENIMNQRPLTYVAEQEDIIPITPSMFLNVHEYVSTDLDINDRNSIAAHIREVQRIRDLVRQRFHDEYLAFLTSRPQRQKEKLIQVGDVVLMGSDDVKRVLWPLARVERIFVGKDGHPRSAELWMKNRKYIRPFNRIYPLEINAGEIGVTDSIKQSRVDQEDVHMPNRPGKVYKPPSKSRTPASSASAPETESHAPKATRTRTILLPARYR